MRIGRKMGGRIDARMRANIQMTIFATTNMVSNIVREERISTIASTTLKIGIGRTKSLGDSPIILSAEWLQLLFVWQHLFSYVCPFEGAASSFCSPM